MFYIFKVIINYLDYLYIFLLFSIILNKTVNNYMQILFRYLPTLDYLL